VFCTTTGGGATVFERPSSHQAEAPRPPSTSSAKSASKVDGREFMAPKDSLDSIDDAARIALLAVGWTSIMRS
jgi:hypothetical protein